MWDGSRTHDLHAPRTTSDPPPPRALSFFRITELLGAASCVNSDFCVFCFLDRSSRKMKTRRKTSAPSAPAGPSTGRRGGGAAWSPQRRPLPPAGPLTCPWVTATTSAPSTAAAAAARAKARARERRPAPPPPPAPATTTRPAGAPPAAPPPTGPCPPSADPPRLVGPEGRRLKDASWKSRPGRREAVC